MLVKKFFFSLASSGIIMLLSRAAELAILSPLVIVFSGLWRAYFVLNSNAQGRQSTKKDKVKLKVRSLNQGPRGSALLNWSLPIFFTFCLYFSSFHAFEGLYFYRHLHFSNFSISACVFLLIAGLLSHCWLTRTILNGRYPGLSLDYIVSLLLLLLYLPFIVLSNTILTMFFFLELASTLVLYNFATSQNWAGLTKTKASSSSTAQSLTTSKYFFNVIFFQFWASFFSSTLIVYAVLNFYLFFGTTEWFYLNFLTQATLISGHQAPLALRLTVAILALGFAIKLGVAPFFAYKVEIYKGLPLYVLFFYSVVYFIIFFTVLVMVFTYYFTLGGALLKNPISLLLAVSCLTLIVFMFDSQALRNFFALSSLVNSTNFLILMLA